jgi:hypothetical protein
MVQPLVADPAVDLESIRSPAANGSAVPQISIATAIVLVLVNAPEW